MIPASAATERGVSAIVCVGVPETAVDALLELACSTAALPCHWFVFGTDVGRLGGLAAAWDTTIELTIVRLPTPVVDVMDAALLILENEGISPDQCVWLQSSNVNGPLPELARASLVGLNSSPESMYGVLLRLLEKH
jgi:hypothetical protein